MFLRLIIGVVFCFLLSGDVLGRANFKEHHDNFYLNKTEYDGLLCNRVCEKNVNRVCYFKFYLELYQAFGVACGQCAKGVVKDCNKPQCIVADGIEKGVMSINRMIPGPAIHVCQGDQIIVDVVNNAQGSAVSLHWHGLHMQKTPFMDGVPYATQCPILYGSSFRYWFDAVEPGTHFYHSHSGHHKINGQYGALIVREPKEVIENSEEYDFDLPEHNIIISDWMHDYGEQLFPGLPSTSTAPNSILINGRGTYINPTTMKQTIVPVTRYYVESGQRYRFRVIVAVSHACLVQLQVEGHEMTVIASDSFNVKARKFDTLVLNAGERYDIVITANHTEGDFYVRARGIGACKSKPMEAFALLRYKSCDEIADKEKDQPPYPAYSDTYPTGRLLNDPSADCSGGSDSCCVTELNALEKDEELRTKEPDQQIFVAFTNIAVPSSEIFESGGYPHFQNPFSNLTFVGAINNISVVFPSSPPLTQPNDIDESEFCDDTHWPESCAGKKYCTCVHKIQIKKDNIVEIVVIDESTAAGNLNHPFHLHGFRYMVTGLGQHPLGLPMTLKAAKQIERETGLIRNHENEYPPFKDTVSIPNRGYAIFRLRADNPGYWLMHCHYEWHMASGMGVIIQVGDQNQMVKTPKGFPTCRNYLPKIKPSF